MAALTPEELQKMREEGGQVNKPPETSKVLAKVFFFCIMYFICTSCLKVPECFEAFREHTSYGKSQREDSTLRFLPISALEAGEAEEHPTQV